MLTTYILAAAAAGSLSSESGSGPGGDSGASAWTGVWLVAAGLALLSAVSFQLCSSGGVIEDRWIIKDEKHQRKTAIN